MGLFDVVIIDDDDARFVCSEGHTLQSKQFQTKDLGCTMGHARITNGRFECTSGHYGDPPELPLRASVVIYAECRQCPAFVQAGTFNLCSIEAEFEVEVIDGLVQSVTRTSPSLAEQCAAYHAAPYMQGCIGPIPYEQAFAIHVGRPAWPVERVGLKGVG